MRSKKIQKSVILSCSNISKKFGQQDVLKGITFTLSKAEKVGLVGVNGSGKSTLLKIIAGQMEKDEGVISRTKILNVEYLPQIHLEEQNLSGGEIAKKILAKIISSDAELFILDEPTNNLDTEGLEMVEDFIAKSDKTFLIVSHDRAFLDKVVSRIIEIDSVTKSSLIYEGNYSAYKLEREARISRQWKEFSDKTERIGKFTDSVDQRLSWMKDIEMKRKNIKNLPMHEKEKPVAAVLRDKEAKAGRRARIMKDRLAKYKESAETVTKPVQLLPLKISFDTEHGSTKVFELKNIEKKIGKRKISPLNLHIQYADRLRIDGKNGTGKTTLLKILSGELKQDAGTLERGENVKIGYISQQRWSASSHKTVLEEFIESTDLNETLSRKLLNRFRITTEDIKKDVSLLSPGEYSRLVIAKLVACKPNCIILDEPSNHLDMEVLEELEHGLVDYKGTLIVVTHDRYFIEKLGLNKTFDLNKYSVEIK